MHKKYLHILIINKILIICFLNHWQRGYNAAETPDRCYLYGQNELLEYFGKKKLPQFQENTFVIRHYYKIIVVEYNELWWKCFLELFFGKEKESLNSFSFFFYICLIATMIYHYRILTLFPSTAKWGDRWWVGLIANTSNSKIHV